MWMYFLKILFQRAYCRQDKEKTSGNKPAPCNQSAGSSTGGLLFFRASMNTDSVVSLIVHIC